MTDYVPSFVDGNELTASQMNLIRGARTGAMKPIDNTTSNYEDANEDLGSSSYRYKYGYFSQSIIDQFTFGDGSDGAFTSANASLTGVKNYTDFTLDNGHTITITNGGLILFVNGTLTLNGTISGVGRNGATESAWNIGGVGGGISGGSDTAASTAGALGCGGGGGQYTQAGYAGGYPLLYGAKGGAGGAGQAGAGGSALQTEDQTYAQKQAYHYLENYFIGIGGGGGSGSGGNGGGGGKGGNGGGGGGSTLIIVCNNLVVGGTGILTCKGGNGANGDYYNGGGGGGGGGNILLKYKTLVSGSLPTLTVSGGTGGTAGAETGYAGSAGSAGYSKTIVI